ncbi:MAG: glutamate 5-kinase [Nitrospirota bacterium]
MPHTLRQHKRIVVKIGSNVIASHEKGLDEKRLEGIALEIAEMRERGHEIFIVSSGAILCGAKLLGLNGGAKTLPMKQAAAAVGQSRLMWAYERVFSQHKMKVAQILLTRNDLSNKTRCLNAKNTLLALLKNKVLSIINENDTVATEEIRFGDNDALAGRVTHLIGASLLVILSDVDGLYTKDPRSDKTAKRISVVEKVTQKIGTMVGGLPRQGQVFAQGKTGGTGGMASKVATAKRVAGFGATTLILNGTREGLIKRALQGEDLGTIFLPKP